MDQYHSKETLSRLGRKIMEIVEDYYINGEATPIVRHLTRSEVLDSFDLAEPPAYGRDLVEVLEEFKTSILPHSVKTWHPQFLNQMFAGASFPSIIGDLMASMMNPTLATWEMSPIATHIEKSVAAWMAKVIGMPKGSSGIFLPGGSLGNLLALMVARNKTLGQAARTKGIDRRCAIITSVASHYSISNAANLMGIGTEQVIKVKVNHRQEMDASDLSEKLDDCQSQGIQPLAVVATLGVTITGGFDPLSDILAICRERQIHVHVDAAFGGGMAFTSSRERLFKGIDEVDSVAWDAHKFMHTPLTCSVLLVPDFKVLKETFSHQADYLFHPQEVSPLEDLAKSTILCGKRFDALKLWLLWQTYGTKKLQHFAQDRMDFTKQVGEDISRDPDFKLGYQPVSPIICFRYEPEPLRRQDTETTKYSDKMHRWIRETARTREYSAFNVSMLNGQYHFRLVLVNPLTERRHIRWLLNQIKSLGVEYMQHHPIKESPR